MHSISLSALKSPLQKRWLVEPERVRLLHALGQASEAHQKAFFERNQSAIERFRAEGRGSDHSGPARIQSLFQGLLDFRELLQHASLLLPPVVPESGLLDMRGVRLGYQPGTVDGEPGYNALKTYDWRGLVFDGIDFSEGGFDSAMLAFSVFRNCLLDGATFSNAHEPEFIGCRMTGADFDEMWGSDLLFDGCQLRSCRLTHFRAGLRGALRSRFQECDFRKGCLLRSYVHDCVFVDCNFARCPWGDAHTANNTYQNCYFEDPWGEPPPLGAVSTPTPPKLKRFSRGVATKRTKAAAKPQASGFHDDAKGFWCLLFRPGARKPEEVLSEALARPVVPMGDAENARELDLELNEMGSDQPQRRFGLSEGKDVAALWTLPLEAPRWFDEAVALSRRLPGPVVLGMAEDDEAGLVGFLSAEAGEVRRLHWEFRVAESQTLDEGAALPCEADNPFKTWLGAKAITTASKTLGYDLDALGCGPFRVVELATGEERGALWHKIEDAMNAKPPPSAPPPQKPPSAIKGGFDLLAGILRLFGR